MARIFGYHVELDLEDHIGRMMYIGAYERQESKAVSRWLKPGMTFVDVGANIGYYTLLATQRVGPTGRVIAVEPSPVVYTQLAETIENNSLPVEHYQLGLSDFNGECTLYLPPDHYHNYSPTMVDHAGSGRPIRVPARRLDDCLDEWGVSSVDLLKIDVEGHEPKVFAGAVRSLASGRIKAVLCEFNDYWLKQSGSSPLSLHAFMTKLGFVDLEGMPRFVSGGLENRFFVFGEGMS